jgi:hypothetical protein
LISARRSSSSLPGSRIASTWSPARISVSLSAICATPARTTEITRAPSGKVQLVDSLPGARRAALDQDLDDLEVFVAQLEQMDELVLRHFVLDEAEDIRGCANGLGDAQQLEVGLVAGIVHTRDHLGHVVPLARDLADDEVVLVVAGDAQDEVGGPGDPGLLEHVQLGRVAEQHLVLELLLQPLVAVRALLDQRHLVAHAQQRAGDVGADLAPAGDDHVHQAVDLLRLLCEARTASASTEIAVCVGRRCACRAARRTPRARGRAPGRRHSRSRSAS